MSMVVELQGTLAERLSKQRDAFEGLYSMGGGRGASFFSRNKNFGSRKESDVILVDGTMSLYTMTADEAEPDGWVPLDRRCLIPEFVVVLTRPDTKLYHLEDWLPKYNAELGMMMFFRGVLLSAAGAVVALFVALLAGFGWWSILAGFAAGLAGVGYFIRGGEYWFRAFLAALSGAFFVWRRVLYSGRNRAEYKTLVRHLALSDDADVRSVHRILQRMV